MVRRRNASQAASPLATSPESQPSQMSNSLRSRIRRRQAAGSAGARGPRRRRNMGIRNRVRGRRGRRPVGRLRRRTVGRSRGPATASPVLPQPVEQQPRGRTTATPRPVGRPRGRPATQTRVLSGWNPARQVRRPYRRQTARRQTARRDQATQTEPIFGYNDDVSQVVPRRRQRGVGRRPRNPNPRSRRSRANSVRRQARIQTVRAPRRRVRRPVARRRSLVQPALRAMSYRRPVFGGHPLTPASRVNQRAPYGRLPDMSQLLRNPIFQGLFPSQHQAQQVPFQMPAAAEVPSQQYPLEF